MALFGEAYRSFFRQTSCFLYASRVAARRTRNVSRPQSSRCTRLCFTLSVFAMSREYIKIHRDFALRNFFCNRQISLFRGSIIGSPDGESCTKGLELLQLLSPIALSYDVGTQAASRPRPPAPVSPVLPRASSDHHLHSLPPISPHHAPWSPSTPPTTTSSPQPTSPPPAHPQPKFIPFAGLATVSQPFVRN